MIASLIPKMFSLKLTWHKILKTFFFILFGLNFVLVEVLRPSQPNGVMSSAVSLPNHTFTGQA